MYAQFAVCASTRCLLVCVEKARETKCHLTEPLGVVELLLCWSLHMLCLKAMQLKGDS